MGKIVSDCSTCVTIDLIGDFYMNYSIDWGFQGVMHRWGMKGHSGVSPTKAHRRVGSIGSTVRIIRSFQYFDFRAMHEFGLANVCLVIWAGNGYQCQHFRS